MDSSSPLSSTTEMASKSSPDRTLSHTRTYAYPLDAWYFLASFIALVSLCHFTIQVVNWVGSNKRVESKPGSRGRRSLLRIPVAILNLVRTVVFRTTISLGGSYTLNLTEFFLGSAYIATLFTWALINTTTVEGIPLSPEYYANRSGLIAATQLPLLIALGMKNNILTFLTGISFDKLNLFHRIVARALCVMLWIHAAGHIIENGKAGNIEDLQQPWFRCGIMAISSFTLLCVFSVQPLRSRAYELFLVSHFFAALIFLSGAYYHADNNGLGYYIWPSLMVWGLDRFLRFVRIFFINGGCWTLFSTKTAPLLRAKIEVISPRFLRITFRRPDHFRWTPGQLAYLSIPSLSAMPWEAHPFTIASIDADIPRARDSQQSSRDESCDKSSVESAVVTTEIVSPPEYTRKIVFLLRVHNGFTKRLLHAASATDTGGAFGAYLDGPYCSPPSVRGFGTVLLFCGGSGISFIFPLLLDLIRGANMGTNPICQRVMLIWAIRRPEQIGAISDDLLQALDGLSISVNLDLRIYITGDTKGDIEKYDHSMSEAKLLGAPAVRVFSGRPSIAEIIESEVAAASGSMSVNVCGTAGMAEHVRSALRTTSKASDILNGGPSISLHVETFGL
ncbi:ferric reductase like transmembrane component-domain-containing protein [Mycena maculata]|uniref:ferric-chelate reductase (NADPH) n=1 Tax=Mycena maculata TaxID=230809 RepID=A0AAD7HL90_9AGAR|nr:ferric reductase like transmembrane component-domain-containing protein [Mycena maculata]